MKKGFLIAGLVLWVQFSFGQAAGASLPRPKLVVGLVVDQMRWDYLYRYYDRYSENGFKRILREGFSCENTNIDYVPTVTAVGHATIYTGTVPAVHGIAGNDFIIEATGERMYCTDDSTVQTVGSTSDAGKMSPRNLLASTITDELMLATNFRSKVVGVALKDRGAILPAGHAATGAYWFDDRTGNFITSTWYKNTLPDWVNRFNENKVATNYLKKDWDPLYPIASYVQSSPDNNRYEGKYGKSATSEMPVKTSQLFNGKNFATIRATPFGNSLTFDFARAAIEGERLGQNVVPDFLAVSCSSTDYVGHKMGVNSIEIEDVYLRLDKDIADFLKYLDQHIGKGNYLFFLSADHGAAHNPNFLLDHKLPAGFWPSGSVQRALNETLEAQFGKKNLVISLGNYQVHLNHPLIKSEKLDEAGIRKAAVSFMREQPTIAFVVDNTEPGVAGVPEPLQERIIRGYNLKRSGVITFVLEPGWYSGSNPEATGTSHGVWNEYDSHIPLLWMGWGVNPGSSRAPVNMTDIAPTIAALLHIQMPNGAIGKPITEVIKK